MKIPSSGALAALGCAAALGGLYVTDTWPFNDTVQVTEVDKGRDYSKKGQPRTYSEQAVDSEYGIPVRTADLYRKFLGLDPDERKRIAQAIDDKVKPLNDELYQDIIQAAHVETVPLSELEHIGELENNQEILAKCAELKRLNEGLGHISYAYSRKLGKIVIPDVSPEEEVLVILNQGVTRDAFLAHESLHYFQDEGSEDQHFFNMIREIQACMATARMEGTSLVLSHADFKGLEGNPDTDHVIRTIVALYGHFEFSGIPDIETARFVGRYGSSVDIFREAFTAAVPQKDFRPAFERGFDFFRRRSDKIEQIMGLGEETLTEMMK